MQGSDTSTDLAGARNPESQSNSVEYNPNDQGARVQTLLYQLERFEIGLVWLDRSRKVVAMNDFAQHTLRVNVGHVFHNEVLSFHPERSREKVKWLLDTAECPVGNPPPMTMMISIPERVLLIKVSKMTGEGMDLIGFCLAFHDITDVVSLPMAGTLPVQRRELKKLPTMRQNRIVLIDVDDVIYIKSDGHYTQIMTDEGPRFCNLAISDLAERLDANRFLRVHRSYLVNLDHADGLIKQGAQVLLTLSDQAQTRVPVSRSELPALRERLGIADH